MIVCSEDFVNKRGLHENAVEILGMEMATDLPSTFNEDSCMKVVSVLWVIADGNSQRRTHRCV